MNRQRFHDWIGLSGITDDENAHARRWAKRLEWPLLLMALWILISWYWSSQSRLTADHEHLLNWCIWLFFVFEAVLLTTLVDNKSRYLKSNWLNLVIILAGIPVLWGYVPYAASLRALRLLIFLSLLLQLSATVRAVLSRNNLGPTLMVSFFIIMIAGYLIAGMDPNIETPADGIWWAWVTVTTVGYGDLVPTSTEGRIFGGLLILMGIGLFSMLTASFSAFFIANRSELREAETGHFQALNKQLERLNQRLDSLEKRLDKLNPESSSPSQKK
jgi:voltage-gated potassium channel